MSRSTTTADGPLFVAVEPPGVPLVAQRSEPVRVIETIDPVSVNEIKPGVFIYDLGQNISGWVRLRVKGRRARR